MHYDAPLERQTALGSRSARCWPRAAPHTSNCQRPSSGPTFASPAFSAPLCQAASRDEVCESAMRLLNTASEMRLLRHRSASLRDLPSASFLR